MGACPVGRGTLSERSLAAIGDPCAFDLPVKLIFLGMAGCAVAARAACVPGTGRQACSKVGMRFYDELCYPIVGERTWVA